jgi:hypothetical protein
MLQIESNPRAILLIESSSDLKLWRPVATVTNTTGTALLPLQVGNEPQAYFRARLLDWPQPAAMPAAEH